MHVRGEDPHQLLTLAETVVGYYCRIHRMSPRWYDDMLSDALYAAATALPRWRPDGGASLRTFLWHRMYGAVIDGIRRRSPVSDRRKYRAGVREADLPQWQKSPMSLEYLAELAESSSEQRTDDWLPDPAAAAALAAVEEWLVVDALLARLPPREGEAVRRIDLNGETGQSVAVDWGVSASYVSQVRKSALRHLRRFLAP